MLSEQFKLTRWRALEPASGGQRTPSTWGGWCDELTAAGEHSFRGDFVHPGWSPCVFDEDYRKKVNARDLVMLVLDYDGGTTIDAALEPWKDNAAFLHTTRRHTEEDHRFRVMVLFSRACSTAEYESVWAEIESKLRARGHAVDVSTKDASRFWFMPGRVDLTVPFVSRRVDGEPLDVDELLVEAATRDGMRERTVSEHRVVDAAPSPTHERYLRAALEGATANVRGARNGTRSNVLNRESYSMGGLVAAGALDERVVETELIEAGVAAGLPRWEAEKTFRSGFTSGLKEPRELPSPSHGGATRPRVSEAPAFPLLTNLFAELPVRNSLIPSLNIGPGAPTGLFAFSWSGKSIIAQDVALSIMTGARVFGQFSARRGIVAHVDYEQGPTETLDRYQRLCRARGIRPDDVAGRFRLSSHPPTFLTSRGAEEELKRLFDGCALALVDSAAAAQPGVPENETQFAEGLYMLARVSETTGAAVVVIGHTGKADLAADKPSNDSRTVPRGTSAIIAACSTAFAVSGGKGEPKRVSMIKGRSLGGAQVEDFFLRLETARIDGYHNPENPADPGGFRVVYQTVEQIIPPRSSARELDAELAQLVTAVRGAGSTGVAGADAAARLAGMRAQACRALVKLAVDRRLLVNISKKKNGTPDEQRPRYVAVDVPHLVPPLRGADEGRDAKGHVHSSRDERDERDEMHEEGAGGGGKNLPIEGPGTSQTEAEVGC